ncbi:hypothetical protein [Methylibium petroleiphilum]
MGKTNDMTDDFDKRLEAYAKKRVPNDEVDASITVYERVKTARAILQSLLPGAFSDASVVAVAVEIGRVKQSRQAVAARE